MNSEKCVWTWILDDQIIWETNCDNAFVFNEGGPVENNFKYCPYCGKEIEVKNEIL